MPDTARRWTAAMVRELPEDGNRYEVVHGVLLVTPAPRKRHQEILRELAVRLYRYLEPLGLHGTLLWSPADISWSDDTLVQPDLFVFPPEESTQRWEDIRTLLLAVEILSPSTRRGDRVIKRRLYQERNVGTYWIVDLEARVVEVWHPGDETPEAVTGTLCWHVAPAAPVLEIPLQELFAEVPSE